jgi:hypothetical protein
MTRVAVTPERSDALNEALNVLGDEEANWAMRTAAAQRLRAAFNMPLEHGETCGVHEDEYGCDCDFWDAPHVEH